MEKLIPLPTMKEFIWDEFMEPLHISVKKMAHDIDVPEAEIQDVLDGKLVLNYQLNQVNTSVSQMIFSLIFRKMLI